MSSLNSQIKISSAKLLCRSSPLILSGVVLAIHPYKITGKSLFLSSETSSTYCAAKPSPSKTKAGSHAYPANFPTEDRFQFGEHPSGWSYGAVFDGHGGWEVAEFAHQDLVSLILKKLASKKEALEGPEIDSFIVAAYQEMEDQILTSFTELFNKGFLEASKIGSCSLVALRKDDQLIIANCGDCRAILGSKGSDQSITATIINRDHNCREPLEKLELMKAHPGEDNIVVCKSARACYVKGRLQLTRSLGDFYLKYPQFNGSPDKTKKGMRYIPPPYTPPYVSHVPDVHQLTLTSDDKFLVLGTDGLWDDLSAYDAVEIVDKMLKEKKCENEIAQALVETALANAAKQCGMTVEDLKNLPAGRARRSRHDDTTAVVMIFNNST